MFGRCDAVDDVRPWEYSPQNRSNCSMATGRGKLPNLVAFSLRSE